MTSIKRSLMAAAGNAGSPLYVEDVFSTYLYTGSGSTQTIANGIDLSGEGGMVWAKNRGSAVQHVIADTLRGDGKVLNPSSTAASGSWGAGSFFAAASNGFSVGGSDTSYNASATDYASWTFRKAEKFFDVVTYTGTGAARTIAHALGSVPGMIIVKRTDTTGDWQVYHRSLTSAAYKLVLNTTAAEVSDSTAWNSTAPTDAVFSVGTNATVNASGGTYVAYIYAHNAGGFGLTGADNVISCGSWSEGADPYTGGDVAVNLGFEPQFVLCKNATDAAYNGSWQIADTMRGLTVDKSGNTQALYANTSVQETTATGYIRITSTGFITNNNATSGDKMIYIAIRRPMKTPEAGTEVFAVDVDRQTSSSSTPNYSSDFPVDLGFIKYYTAAVNWEMGTRLTGETYLSSSTTAAEATSTDWKRQYMDGFGNAGAASTDFMGFMFKRAPEFFDVVCYAGDSVADRTIDHGLGVVPEMMWVKRRNTAGYPHLVYHKDFAESGGYVAQAYLQSTGIPALNSMFGAHTSQTSSVFALGNSNLDFHNHTAGTYIAYLFATLDGVSKVGSYTADATLTTIDCGFTAGARFVLIKRTDSTGDWYMYDSESGIVAGNDPYLLINTSGAQATGTDYIDPDNSGFQLTAAGSSTINIDTAEYIFLAIA